MTNTNIGRLTIRAIIFLTVAVTLMTGCKSNPDAEKYAKIITFTTSEPAPQGFDAWSFEWSSPRHDDKAQLDYIVRRPDGSVYFQAPIPTTELWNPSTDARSDFGVDGAGGDPSAFYGRMINVTFRVDKGSLIFSPDRFYTFTFYKDGLDGDVIGTRTGIMGGD